MLLPLQKLEKGIFKICKNIIDPLQQLTKIASLTHNYSSRTQIIFSRNIVTIYNSVNGLQN